MSIDRIENFAEAVAGVRDPDELCDSFSVFLEPHGLDGFAYFRLDGNGRPDRERSIARSGAAREMVGVSVGPERTDWVDAYFDRQLFRHDPILDSIATRPRPILWSTALNGEGLEQVGERFRRAAATVGIDDAIAIPIHGFDDQCEAVVSLTASEGRHAVSAFLYTLAPVHLSVLQLHLKLRPALDRRARFPVGQRLTVRERECFMWIAKGKSNWEVGQILGIAERTVNFHVENVRRKLNVGSRMQALIELILSGDIEP